MKTIEQIAQFFNDSEYFTGSVKINENLAKHTTMNVGGNAKLFLEPKDGESLVFAVRYFIEENVKFFVLGGGSNVIISDAGLDAVISTRKMNQVKFLTEGTEDTESLIEGEKLLNPESPLCPPNLCIKFLTEGTEHTESLIEGKKLLESESPLCSQKPYEHSSSGDSLKSRCDFLTLPICEEFKNPLNPCESSLILEVDSGSSWGSVISFCKKNNLGGFESFSGLSGTVGGALFMNATCFGLSACDNLLSVRYFDLTDGKIHEYEKVDSDWGYKKSPFQIGRKEFDADGHELTRMKNGDFKGEPLRSGGSGKRDSGCSEGETSPFPLLTAHCSLLISKIILSAKFSVKNGFDSEKSEKCMSDRREKGHFRAPSSGSAFKNDAVHGIIAGKVIDECGLKGFSVGGAQIAPWHGNFIINPERKATARDIKELSARIKEIVLEKTGFSLENEILFIE